MDKNYWDLFFAEAQEYMGQINNALVILEKDPDDENAIQEIFRFMHTLKGMAATMGFQEIANFAHKIEDAFDLLRSGKARVTKEMMDILFDCMDAFTTMIEDIRNNKQSSINPQRYIDNLQQAMQGNVAEQEEVKSSSPFSKKIVLDENLEKIIEEKRKEGKQIFKINIQLSSDCPMKGARAFLIFIRLKEIGQIITSFPPEDILKKGEFDTEIVIIIATAESKKIIQEELLQMPEIANLEIEPFDIIANSKQEDKLAKAGAANYIRKIQSMRIPVERLDKIMNFMGELAIAKSRLVQTIQSEEKSSLEETTFLIDRLVSSLQDEILQMRLLPISYILDSFPRIVRDLARSLGKEVELEIIGSEIELDRVVLDEIGDPLVHLVRNAIDHGIEDVATRKQLGKPERGNIKIKVSRDKGHVIIEISDDGKGIDIEKIKEKAIAKGIINEKDLLHFDLKQALDIMTTPGFSTSNKVTDISGRGVGLDVVRTKIDSLGGRLDVESEKGKGTKFLLTLPLTLAIIKAMLVSIGEEIFAIPLMNICESVKVKRKEIKPIQQKDVVKIRDEIIPLIWLDQELGCKYSSDLSEDVTIIVVEGRVKSLGIVVDKIIGEQDIVVKPLGAMVKRIRGIAGATILGNGRVALILDVVNLM